MGSKIMSDPRLDPRIKAMMGGMAEMEAQDAESREALLAEASSEEAVARREAMALFMDMVDNEEVAPSAGLEVSTRTFTSAPDGNEIKIQFIRPEGGAVVPCVYYIHGGGMQAMSCFDGMYRAWGRMIAARRAWRWPWSTSATVWWRPRRRRWSRFRPVSTTVFPA